MREAADPEIRAKHVSRPQDRDACAEREAGAASDRELACGEASVAVQQLTVDPRPSFRQ